MKIWTMGLLAGSSILAVALCLVGAEANRSWQPPEPLDMVVLQDLIHTEMNPSERMAGMIELLRDAMQTTGAAGRRGWAMAPGWAQMMVTSTMGRHIPRELIILALEAEEDPEMRDHLRIAATLAGSEGFRDD